MKVEIFKLNRAQMHLLAKPFDGQKYGCVNLRQNKQVNNYICVENGESFYVGISCVNKQDPTTYGAVLYLNGMRVPGKKTFKGRTTFQGFK